MAQWNETNKRCGRRIMATVKCHEQTMRTSYHGDGEMSRTNNADVVSWRRWNVTNKQYGRRIMATVKCHEQTMRKSYNGDGEMWRTNDADVVSWWRRNVTNIRCERWANCDGLTNLRTVYHNDGELWRIRDAVSTSAVKTSMVFRLRTCNNILTSLVLKKTNTTRAITEYDGDVYSPYPGFTTGNEDVKEVSRTLWSCLTNGYIILCYILI